jgi:hypothetical protein
MNSPGNVGIMFVRWLSAQILLSGVTMSNNKKTQASYAKQSRADIVRSVVTSTAVETGQSSAKIEASLEAMRKKFAHLRLAV